MMETKEIKQVIKIMLFFISVGGLIYYSIIFLNQLLN